MQEETVLASAQVLIALQPCELLQYILMHRIDIDNSNSAGSFGLPMHTGEEVSPNAWTKRIEKVEHGTLGKVIIQRVDVQH